MSGRDGNLLAEVQRDALDKNAPLSDTLRKLVALGGQAGSVQLREWASLELRGYLGSDVELPDYRIPSALLQVDALKGNYQITGQQISPRFLPDFAQEHIGEEVRLLHSVGEIEAMLGQAQAAGGAIKITLQKSQDLIALMNHESNEPYQHIVAVYWSLSAPALAGVLDRVRTNLVELVAEMRAGMSDSADTPSQAVADQAVNVVVHGKGARVNVTAAKASGDGSHTVSAQQAPQVEGHSRWRRIGAFVVGLATIAGVVIALAQWQGWGF
jgi:AbiTii